MTRLGNYLREYVDLMEWSDEVHDNERAGGARLRVSLLVDGQPAGGFDTPVGFVSFISWSGLDIGRDRASPVSHYEAPFAFTGLLRKVTMTMDDDQALDAGQAAEATLATE